jgi:NTE family protein
MKDSSQKTPDFHGYSMSDECYDHQILLLQGGGALGAYHAGVYEGLAEADMMPTWVVGISIGAVNAAIIAGNPPERRLERLREFWDLVSAYAPMTPPSLFDPIRPVLGHLSVWSVATLGIQGFFVPRHPSPLLAPAASPDAVSFYDTAPLKKTLEELVDFDLINEGKTRLSLGSANVRTGESVYFDTRRTRITPEHVMASGALPPGFPGIEIDGEQYWDGGLVSNTPITYVWDQKPLTTALIVQVNLFPSRGEVPRDLEEVMERMKDIQYCSKLRFSTERIKELGELRAAATRLLAKLPPDMRADPDVQQMARHSDTREWTIAFLTDSYRSCVGQWKDADFSRATVNERWAGGVEAVRRSLANREWTLPSAGMPGVRVYNLPPAAPTAGARSGNGDEDRKTEVLSRPPVRRFRRRRSTRSSSSPAALTRTR